MIEINTKIKAFIFDLDGVITDTAEYHYLSWKRFAEEEKILFNRRANEQFRGVPRNKCLEILLGDREVPETKFNEMMERKNNYYRDYINGITEKDILPGARELLIELKDKGFRLALASASKNAKSVIEKLGIEFLFDVVADGYSVERQKPAPDLFLYAVRKLGVQPAEAVVVEDAKAGIDAALAANMVAVGIGPEDRVGHAHYCYPAVAEMQIEEIV